MSEIDEWGKAIGSALSFLITGHSSSHHSSHHSGSDGSSHRGTDGDSSTDYDDGHYHPAGGTSSDDNS